MPLPTTIEDAAAALRARTLSCVELTEALLRRIDRLDPLVGAFQHVMHDTARTEAAAADALFARGIDRGPMQGIPYAVKDILSTRDAPTTAMSRVLARDWGGRIDATVVAKLRAAGAVTVGKLVLSEFALGLPYEGSGFPMPRNPWDLERSAAGSSSGTGIAVATGMILGGIGTDTGGSTRGPAAFNGHTGLKQTFGRVSKAGCVPLAHTLDHVNPMARSAWDCAAMLGVMAGHDPLDPTSVDRPVPDYLAALDGDVRALVIGMPLPYFYDHAELDPEVRRSVLDAVDVLRRAGASVREVVVPHAAEAKFAAWVTLYSEAFAWHRENLRDRYHDYGPPTAEALARGALFTAADYLQAQRFRSYFRKAVAELMREVDVLVTPTMPVTAPRRSDMSHEKGMLAANYMAPWNLAGLPAMAVPCGFSASGLPISMQIVGRAFDEATVLRVGDAYQRHTNHHLRIPPIAADPA